MRTFISTNISSNLLLALFVVALSGAGSLNFHQPSQSNLFGEVVQSQLNKSGKPIAHRGSGRRDLVAPMNSSSTSGFNLPTEV